MNPEEFAKFKREFSAFANAALSVVMARRAYEKSAVEKRLRPVLNCMDKFGKSGESSYKGIPYLASFARVLGLLNGADRGDA